MTRLSTALRLSTNTEAQHEYRVDLAEWKDVPIADAAILAVAHNELLDTASELLTKVKHNGCLIDVKSRLDSDAVRRAGLHLWRL
jgi:UDP-N-acetyl-D-glucosamine/UDP-N-acetyl-D-galactosamine dehydrogenase